MMEFASAIILAVVAFIMGGIVFVTHIHNKKLKILLTSLEQQLKNKVSVLERKAFFLKMVAKKAKKEQEGKSSKGKDESKSHKREKGSTSEKKIKRNSLQSKASSTAETDLVGKERPLYDGDLIVDLKKVTPFLDEFGNHPEQYNVCSSVIPGFLYNSLPSHAPEEPCSLEEIWKDYERFVWPGYTHWQHPNFLAYFPCGRSAPDTLAELLISTLCVPAEDWASCPSLNELEFSMINWIGRGLGLPEEMLFHGNTETSPGGGVMLESASECTFSAVTIARTRKINEVMLQTKEVPSGEHFHFALATKSKLDRHHEIAGRLVVYASTEAHSCIEKGCRMAIVQLRQLKGDPSKDFAVTGEILERAIKEDIANGKIPCMMHVILGSTSSCCYDNLTEIGPIAKKYGMWVHVDAAYLGSMWIEPAYRTKQEGLEYIDSININLHKMLLHSNAMSILWTKDMKALRGTYGSHGETNRHKGMGDDTAALFMHDTRRHKGLKAFLTFRYRGTEGLREYIRNINDMAAYLRGLMITHPNVRMFGELKPAFFAFQYYEPKMSEEEVAFHSECLRTLMNETGEMWISFTKVHEHGIIRVTLGYEKTNKEDMDRLWATMKSCIETYRERRNDPNLMRFPPKSPSSAIKTAVQPTPPTSPTLPFLK